MNKICKLITLLLLAMSIICQIFLYEISYETIN